MFDFEIKLMCLGCLAGSLVLIADMVFWMPF